jgi:hypothetical protein
MKPFVCTLAGAAVVLALAAGPLAAQGRERPAGAGGGGATGGEAGVRNGGGASGNAGGGTSGGSVSQPSGSSGSGSGSTYSSPHSSGSSGSSASGAAWRSNPANGRSSYVREMYGSPNDRAVPRGARPNPGGPTVGQAVPRSITPVYRPGGGNDGNFAYYSYYPYFPYGFGAFGLGYLYYDPFWYGYGSYGGYGYGDYGYGGYGGYGYGGSGYYGDDREGRGGLKLKVEPKDAEVYVDGYYMGTVDDFNGTFQRMELEAGPHRVEIRAAGFQTITFDVRIEPNDTVTYRGQLQLQSKR